MPAATTQADLLTRHETEWAKLKALLIRVSEAQAVAPDEAGACIKDIVSHRAHWIGLFFQWVDEGAAAQMPDHGVKWSELKRHNAALRDRYGDRDWTTAQDDLTAAAARLSGWIAAQPDGALYGGPMPGGTGWTTGRYAEAAGPSHFRSAAKYIRARLRNG